MASLSVFSFWLILCVIPFPFLSFVLSFFLSFFSRAPPISNAILCSFSPKYCVNATDQFESKKDQQKKVQIRLSSVLTKTRLSQRLSKYLPAAVASSSGEKFVEFLTPVLSSICIPQSRTQILNILFAFCSSAPHCEWISIKDLLALRT